MKNMIGYCGLDCEKCDAYLATINDDQALREKTAKLWVELNNAPILPEHINCEGCRANGAKTTVIYSYFFIINRLSMYDSLRIIFHYIRNKLYLLLFQVRLHKGLHQ